MNSRPPSPFSTSPASPCSRRLEGLSQDDLVRPVVTTGTSILRLIRHLVDGERFWFILQLQGKGEEPDWDAAATDDRPAAEIIAEYRAAIRASDQAIRELADLDALAIRPVDGRRTSLRWTLAHMTSETARHAGHADIVREQLDGASAASLLMAVEGREGNDFIQPWTPAG